jgi:hypothetical protein
MIERALRSHRRRLLGQGVTEYVIVTALVALVAVTALGFLGRHTSESFCQVSNGLNNGGGNFFGMGRNESGQLGTGQATSPASATPVRAQMCGNTLASGRNESAAVANDGTLYIWGLSDGYGELGPNGPSTSGL